jgi:hypothetical protein
MPQIIEVPGHGDVEFPDGMTDDQISAAIQQNMGGQQPATEAKPYMGLDAAKERVRGIAQTTVVPAAQLMARGMDFVGNTALRASGFPENEYLKSLPGRADDFAEEMRAEGGGPANFEGQMLGMVPAGGLRIAGGALANRVAQGAVGGAQAAPTNDMSAEGNVALGAGLSAVLPPAVARVVSPAANAGVRFLADRGVRLTPGQILGPTAKRVEDAARSIPLVGDAVSGAQRRSFASFNEAVINDALQPIGGRVQGAGREAVESAQRQVSNAYESLLPRLRVAADGQAIQELQGVQQMAAALPPELQPRLNHIIQTEVLGKFTSQGRMSGETMKAVEAQLGQLAKGLSASQDVYERQMAGGVRELQRILRGVTERSNPQHAGQLQAINQSYARLQRVNDAASRVTSEDGIFTPEAFSGAVKKGDASKGKRNFAAGNALSQDISDAARSVMGNRVPDSGTARRLLTGGGLAGGAAMLEPNALTIGAAASLPYLPGVEAVVRNALLRRPASAPQFANALRNRGGALVGPALVGGSAVRE